MDNQTFKYKDLFEAMKKNDLIEFKNMIKSKKWNPNQLNSDGDSLLHEAWMWNRYEFLKYLIEEVEEIDLNIRNRDGKTVLYQAIYYCDGRVARWLVKAGASKEGLEKFSDLKIAIVLGNLKEMKQLIRNGANLNQKMTLEINHFIGQLELDGFL